MEAWRNLREAVYDLIDLRSVREEANVGPPRPQADQMAQAEIAQVEAAIDHGPLQGRDQG